MAKEFIALTDTSGRAVYIRPGAVAFVAKPSGVAHKEARARVGLASGATFDVSQSQADVVVIVERWPLA